MKKIIATLLIMSIFSQPMTAQAKDEIPKDIWNAAKEVGYEQCMPPEWYIATGERESGLNPRAIGDNGKAFGICQVQYRWVQDILDEYGYTPEDLFNTKKCFRVAGRIFTDHLDKYRYTDLCELKYNGVSDAEYRFETGILSDYVKWKKNRINELQRGQ